MKRARGWRDGISGLVLPQGFDELYARIEEELKEPGRRQCIAAVSLEQEVPMSVFPFPALWYSPSEVLLG